MAHYILKGVFAVADFLIVSRYVIETGGLFRAEGLQKD